MIFLCIAGTVILDCIFTQQYTAENSVFILHRIQNIDMIAGRKVDICVPAAGKTTVERVTGTCTAAHCPGSTVAEQRNRLTGSKRKDRVIIFQQDHTFCCRIAGNLRPTDFPFGHWRKNFYISHFVPPYSCSISSI